MMAMPAGPVLVANMAAAVRKPISWPGLCAAAASAANTAVPPNPTR